MISKFRFWITTLLKKNRGAQWMVNHPVYSCLCVSSIEISSINKVIDCILVVEKCQQFCKLEVSDFL